MDGSCAVYYQQNIFFVESSYETCVEVNVLWRIFVYLSVYRCRVNVMCEKRLSKRIRAQQTFPICLFLAKRKDGLHIKKVQFDASHVAEYICVIALIFKQE